MQFSAQDRTPLDRDSMAGALRNLTELGHAPATVFDVGAATGTLPLYAAFPQAHHVLIEPLAECEQSLLRIASTLPRSDIFIGVAGSEPGNVSLNVHADLSGTSVLREAEGSKVDGLPRMVPQQTLDDLATHLATAGPYFIKLDTQGSELEVLKGAEMIVLPRTDAVLVETSLLAFFENGPLIHELISYMQQTGFSIYDIVDLQYRPLDGAMSQADLLFVRTNSHLRQDHRFATMEQRRRADARMTRKHRRTMRL
jgi:FkbM family methyltransferase